MFKDKVGVKYQQQRLYGRTNDMLDVRTVNQLGASTVQLAVRIQEMLQEAPVSQQILTM